MLSPQERTPPPGAYRLIFVDTFDGEDWVKADYGDLTQAVLEASTATVGKQMLKAYVYNDSGVVVFEAGQY